MNLLIIPSWYPSKGSPVNGIFFREQAIALSKKGHNVTLIDVTFHGREDIFNSKNFRYTYTNDNGVHTYLFKIPSFYILTRMPSLFIFLYKMLLSIVFKKVRKRGVKFDIIHAHSFYPAGYCACSLSRKYQIPLVVTEHNTNVLQKELTIYQHTLLRYTIGNCNKFVCVSESLRQSMEELTQKNDKLVVVPNMYSADFGYNDVNKSRKKEFVFLSVGFLNERKRHDFAIRCFEKAFKDDPNVRFEIIGKGHLFDSLQEQIIDCGLSEKISLLGSLDKKQLVQKMKDCDIFILVSTFENFGVVYVEAMACGKPVIAAKNGGANDIVNNTNGVLIEKDNEEQLIKAFQYMYQNAEKFDAKQIAADCYAKYSEDAVVKNLTNIYEEIKGI